MTDPGYPTAGQQPTSDPRAGYPPGRHAQSGPTQYPAPGAAPPAGSAPPAPYRPPPEESDPSVALLRIARWLVMFVYVLAMVSVVMLTITFFLRLFGASTTAPFVEWIYRSEGRAMTPFRGIFPPIETDGRSVLDVSILFAMLMYGLLAVAVHGAVDWFDRKLHEADWQRQQRAVATDSSGTRLYRDAAEL